jgi:hypothetical protein
VRLDVTARRRALLRSACGTLRPGAHR